jgi:hypothetical protein
MFKSSTLKEMEERTRLGLAIFLFGVLLVSVILLIREVIPPVHVLPDDAPQVEYAYETRFLEDIPYSMYSYKTKESKRKHRDASGNYIE